MSELTDVMVRNLKKRLGHGGYCCALHEGDFSEFMCRVPWRYCSVTFGIGKPGELIISLKISYRDRNGVTWTCQNGHGTWSDEPRHFYGQFSMYPYTFCPDKATDDVVSILKLIKHGFRRQKQISLSKFPPRVMKRIVALWPEIGQVKP